MCKDQWKEITALYGICKDTETAYTDFDLIKTLDLR